jgi:hypothetical protein
VFKVEFDASENDLGPRDSDHDYPVYQGTRNKNTNASPAFPPSTSASTLR